jgi:hypothetical protein
VARRCCRLDHIVVSGLVGARTVAAETVRNAGDNVGPDCSHRRFVKPETLEGLAPHCRHEDVGGNEQGAHCLPAEVGLEVEHDAALVPVHVDAECAHHRVAYRLVVPDDDTNTVSRSPVDPVDPVHPVDPGQRAPRDVKRSVLHLLPGMNPNTESDR